MKKHRPLCLPGTEQQETAVSQSARDISATHRHLSHVYVLQ